MTQEPMDGDPLGDDEGMTRLAELAQLARLAWRLLLDERVPMHLKLIPVAALVYLVSPLDLVPDVFPLVSQIDDVAVLLLAARLFVRLAPAEVVEDLSDGGEGTTVDATYRVREP